jgi:hypothetical protein
MAVRGYADYKPKPETVHWIRSTRQVLEEYRDYWPLTVRQLFYRLVADHGYEKSEAAYGRLTGILSRARRAGYIEWKAIRDGGLGRSEDSKHFEDQDHFERSIRSAAENLTLDRQRDQDKVIELWCEAGGMVPILQGIAHPYSCRVNSGGGYDSVTAKHKLALRVRDRAKEELRTVILHVGDFDGSGEDMASSLFDDVRYMVAARVFHDVKGGPPKEEERKRIGWALDFFELERVALTAEQVLERGVETAPPKPTDSRTRAFAERNAWLAEELGTPHISAQLEALTPPELTDVISEAIERHLDMDVYRTVLEEEEPIRESILTWLDGRGD